MTSYIRPGKTHMRIKEINEVLANTSLKLTAKEIELLLSEKQRLQDSLNPCCYDAMLEARKK